MVIDKTERNLGDTGLEVAIDESPDALIFKNRFRSDVRADICGECGYIEIYATNPHGLYRTYQISMGEIEQ